MYLYVVKILGLNTHCIVTSDHRWQTAGQGTMRGLLAETLVEDKIVSISRCALV
jgi:hypothetical protein